MAQTAGVRVFMFLTAICGLLPLLVLGVREDNKASYQSAKTSEGRTSLHVRVDGKQMRLKPTSLSVESVKAPPVRVREEEAAIRDEAPAKTTSLKPQFAVMRNKHFFETLDPRGSPMLMIFWILIVGAIVFFVVDTLRRLGFFGASDDPSVPLEGQTQDAAPAEGKDLVDEDDAETNETNEKLKALRAEKTKLMMEQAARKSKLEKVIEEMLEHEAELAGKAKPTEEEARKLAEQAMANADMAAHRNILMAVAYAAPLVTQTQKIYTAVEQRIQKTQERAKDIILEESKETLKELQCAFGYEDMENLDCHVLDEINIPSLAAIMAAAFAPAQLRLLFAMNWLFMIMSVVFVAMDIVVLGMDWHAPCMSIPVPEPPPGSSWHAWAHVWWQDAQNNHIYLWFMVDCVVHFLCLLIRIPVVRRVSKMLQTIKAPPMTEAKDPIEALKHFYQFYTTTGAAALTELDLALKSYVLFLANWSVFFDTCWLFYGTDLVWNTPWSLCYNFGIVVLRTRVTLFQILFIVYIMQLLFFAVGQLMQGDGFSVWVITKADQWDEAFGMGFPIAKVVCHALAVRHTSDMIAIQMNMQQTEKDRLLQKKEKAAAVLNQIQGECDKAEKLYEELEKQRHEAPSRFGDEGEMQAQYDEMHSKIKDDSIAFAKAVADRSVKATQEAEQRLDEWERGEGGDLVQAFAKGEGFTRATEMLNEANASMEAQAQAGLAQAQAAAADSGLAESALSMGSALAETAQEGAATLQRRASDAMEFATSAAAATGAEDAAGGSPSAGAAPLVAEASAKAAVAPPRRSSQADAGAGGPPPTLGLADTW